MTRKPLQAVGGVLLASALVLTACGGSDQGGETTQTPTNAGAEQESPDSTTPAQESTEGTGGTEQEAIPLRVAWVGALIGTPDWVAFEEELFAERGLDVEMVSQQNGPNALAAALVGEVDVFFGPLSNVIAAAEQGECFKFISSGIGNTVNIIARSDWELSSTGEGFPGSIADLKGATIGVPALGSATDRLTRLTLEEAGLDPETDVDIIQSGVGPTAVAAFQSGEVDALASFPPMEQLLDDSEYQVVADLVGNPDTSPIAEVIASHSVVTCDFLENNEEAVLRYCRALWDAHDFMSDSANAERVADIIGPYLSAEGDMALGIWEQYGGAFSGPTLTRDQWQAQAQFNPEGLTEPPPYEEWVYEPCVQDDPRA